MCTPKGVRESLKRGTYNVETQPRSLNHREEKRLAHPSEQGRGDRGNTRLGTQKGKRGRGRWIKRGVSLSNF